MKMKNILRVSFFLVILISVISCKKDDSTSSEIVLRDRQEVYDENIIEIESYLQSNYLELDADLNATVKEIDGSQTSIWDDATYPLQSMIVKNDVRTSNFTDGVSTDVVDYKLYYVILNEGGGVNPAQVDSVFTAYKGWDFESKTFDQNNQGIWFTYPQTTQFDPLSISGYRQVLSKIKTEASSTLNGNGTTTHTDYGNVLVFIPSGLAYFNSSISGKSYNPIAFQIKLFSRKQNDHDRDRIKSNNEDLNGDNDYYNDDSDGDKIPNFLDIDDDGDGIVTKAEIIETNDGNGNITYYSFDNIPFCNPGSIKKHLDASCH
jgi:FKBP-type peptidyl-prolyl cis-trans isomerase FkpA